MCDAPKSYLTQMTQSAPLACTSSCTERRHDRLFGLFNVIHHVTTTRSDFVSPFFVPTSVAANLLSQPVLSTSHHQPVTPTNHQPVSINQLSNPLLHPFRLAVHPLNRCINHISAGDRYCLSCLLFCLLCHPDYCPVITPLLYRQD